MEFLVTIRVALDPDLPAARRDELLRAESERAAELAGAGLLKRLWRIPGERANHGLWEAADATELHDAIASLPLWPWMTVEVVALARHPNDPGAGDDRPR